MKYLFSNISWTMTILIAFHSVSECLCFKPKSPVKTSFASRSRIAKSDHSEPHDESLNQFGNVPNEVIVGDNHPNDIFQERVPHDHYFAHTLAQKASVDMATRHWMAVVSSGDLNAPQLTTQLYREDGVIWGTVSQDLRKGHKEIRQYFEFFARQKELSVVPGSYKSHIQLCSDSVAVSSGYYTFQCLDESLNVPPNTYRIVPARFTFIFEKQPTSSFDTMNCWKIVNHHSSVIPEQPSGLASIHSLN